MAGDEIDALLATGDVAGAAARARERGQLGRAVLLYERIWDFTAAAEAARQAGDAEAELRNLLDAHDLAAAVALGDKMSEAGRALAAAGVFEARRQPGEAARLYERGGELGKAQTLFARAAQHVEAGRLAEALGDEPGAGRAYERAIADAADPREVARAHLALGKLHARRGRNDLAARYLQEATRHEDTRVEAGKLLPRTLVALGLRDAALAALTRAREHDSSLPADLDALLGAGSGRARARASTTGPVNDVGRLVGGRYRLGRLLGAGGSGRVHEAEDVESARKVAVKLFYAAQARGQEAYARFVREARVCGALKHAHIVEVIDFREDAGFFVMELMSGGTLADRMNPRLAPAPLRRAALDVLAGLEAAHAAGVVHRDLKPANVFFDERGVAKLGDFGVAHLLDLGQTQTGGLIGTLAYMAPEQVTGAPLGFAADLYALGVTLFQALTGRLPLPGPDFLAQHLGETPPPASQVWAGAAGWDAVLGRLLAKDPAARHDSLAELRAELIGIDVSDARRVLVLGGAGREAAEVVPAVEAPVAPEPRPVRASTAPPSRYQHETPLGDTPLSTLVRAVDGALSRSVVIERFAEGQPDEGHTRRLKALAAAHGPHLSRVLSFDRATRVAVYEAPMGETLIAHLSRAPLSVRAAIRLLGELALALEPLHAAGVAHGSLSADRVLLDEGGAATLACAGLPPIGNAGPADDAAALAALVAQSAGVAHLSELWPEKGRELSVPADAAGLAALAERLEAAHAAAERRRAHLEDLEQLAADAADQDGAKARLAALR